MQLACSIHLQHAWHQNETENKEKQTRSTLIKTVQKLFKSSNSNDEDANGFTCDRFVVVHLQYDSWSFAKDLDRVPFVFVKLAMTLKVLK